jgi:transposase
MSHGRIYKVRSSAADLQVLGIFAKSMRTYRLLIENFFARLKQYRAIATRYDKTARNFLGAIHLAASIVCLA